MEGFLKSIYPPSGTPGEFYRMKEEERQSVWQSHAIDAGAFTLLGPDKQRLWSWNWSSEVKPHWEIEFLFDDSKLNRNSTQFQLEKEKENLPKRVKHAGIMERLKGALSGK